MSVLFRVMKMPESCKACRIDGRDCRRWMLFTFWKTQRAPGCPLVYVPEHGYLIDQSEYRDEFINGIYGLCGNDPTWERANAIIDLFDSAPVIIPAEKEEKP